MIMIFYYLISAYLAAMVGWNFLRERKKIEDLAQYLIVLIPLLLRILRIK